MSFADSMDDLEAMNDPRNTAESVVAAHLARKARPGRIRQALGWLRALFRGNGKRGQATAK